MYASVKELRRSSPILERKLLFSNFNTENDRSAVAVDADNVAKNSQQHTTVRETDVE